ncbi:unnamed protein product, partial [Prorocentrum cordatum]
WATPPLSQALAQLIERSPEPGVYGLHLSHNYMSQVGVGMMLVSAVKTGFYPVQLPDSGGPVPLWLRVHDQQCPWPVLSSTGTEQRSSSFDKAKGLLSHLSKTLVQKFLLPKGKQLPDGFELFCMPKPTSNAWSSNTEVEAGAARLPRGGDHRGGLERPAVESGPPAARCTRCARSSPHSRASFRLG